MNYQLTVRFIDGSTRVVSITAPSHAAAVKKAEQFDVTVIA